MKKCYVLQRCWIGQTTAYSSRRALNRSSRLLTAKLEPVDPTQSYFQLFSLDPTYDVSLSELKKRFLDYQRKVHPDSYSTGDRDQADRAAAWSELVNKAYKTLQSPLERAEYILERNSVQIAEGESLEDPELLGLILETRETLESAQEEVEVDQIRQLNSETTKSTVAQLSEAFEAKDYDAAKALTVKLRYLTNIEQACREWAPGKRVELQH